MYYVYGNSRTHKYEKGKNGRMLSLKQSIPKRNDICPCGRGKKYKKCCGKPISKYDTVIQADVYDLNHPQAMDLLIFLDGEIVNPCLAASVKDGWVDRISTKEVDGKKEIIIGPDKKPIVRREKGKVDIKLKYIYEFERRKNNELYVSGRYYNFRSEMTIIIKKNDMNIKLENVTMALNKSNNDVEIWGQSGEKITTFRNVNMIHHSKDESLCEIIL